MEPIKELLSITELDAAIEESKQQPILIFKHSNTCPISAAAKREIEAYCARCIEDKAPVYQVVVQISRTISNEIAERLGINHESPQILLLANGEVQWHTSHYSINLENIENAVRKLQ